MNIIDYNKNPKGEIVKKNNFKEIQSELIKLRKEFELCKDTERCNSIIDRIDITYDLIYDEVTLVLNMPTVLKNNNYEFLCNFITNCKIVKDYKQTSITSHCYKNHRINIIVNPLLIGVLPIVQQIDCYVHEGYHIILEHLIRKSELMNEGKKEEVLNVAIDLVANRYFKEDFNKDMENSVTFASMLREYKHDFDVNKFEDCTVEVVYSKIEKFINEQLKEEEKKQEKEEKKEQNKPNNDVKEEIPQKNDENNNTNSKIKEIKEALEDSKTLKGKTANGKIDRGTNELINNIVKNTIERVASKTRILGEGSLSNKINEFIAVKPVVIWKKELNKYIGNVLKQEKIRNAKRLNRRNPDRLDLRGKKRDKEVVVYVYIDTSGSVGYDGIKTFLNELTGMVKGKNTKIIVSYFTSTIEKTYELKKVKDLDLEISCGGTCIEACFRHFNDNASDKDVFICFTDGYTEDKVNIGRFKAKAYLFCILDDKNNFTMKDNLPNRSRIIVIPSSQL